MEQNPSTRISPGDFNRQGTVVAPKAVHRQVMHPTFVPFSPQFPPFFGLPPQFHQPQNMAMAQFFGNSAPKFPLHQQPKQQQPALSSNKQQLPAPPQLTMPPQPLLALIMLNLQQQLASGAASAAAMTTPDNTGFSARSGSNEIGSAGSIADTTVSSSTNSPASTDSFQLNRRIVGGGGKMRGGARRRATKFPGAIATTDEDENNGMTPVTAREKEKHKCDYCGKSFDRNWLLTGHLRTHTKEKPYECEFCGKTFSDRSNMRAHTKIHSETKDFQCSFCLRQFKVKSYLTKHLDVHRDRGIGRSQQQFDPATTAAVHAKTAAVIPLRADVEESDMPPKDPSPVVPSMNPALVWSPPKRPNIWRPI